MLEKPFMRFNVAAPENYSVKQKPSTPMSDFKTFLDASTTKPEHKPEEGVSSDGIDSTTKANMPDDEDASEESVSNAQNELTEEQVFLEDSSAAEPFGAGVPAAKASEQSGRLAVSFASRGNGAMLLTGQGEPKDHNAEKTANVVSAAEGRAGGVAGSSASGDDLIMSSKVEDQNTGHSFDRQKTAGTPFSLPAGSEPSRPFFGMPGSISQKINGTKASSIAEPEGKPGTAANEQDSIAEDGETRINPTTVSRVDSSGQYTPPGAVTPQLGAAGYLSAMTLAKEKADPASALTESMLAVELDAELKPQSGEGPYNTSIQELARKAAVQTMYRPENIARQVVEAIHRTGDNRVEIRLNPDELGRVQIQMTTTEAGIVMSMISERPETSELLRRHIDLLAQEFEGMGYADVEFKFDEEGANGGQQATPNHERPAENKTDTVKNHEHRETPTMALSGIDIRI